MTARLAVVALAACSGSHRPFPMEAPDAMPDSLGSQTADAPPGAVTLTVVDHGVPAAGVAVYFQRADSSLVASIATDAHGTAGALLPDGFVTAIASDKNGSARLSTFAGVKPGDALQLELGPGDPPGGAILDVVIPTTAGAIGYDVHTPCGNGPIDATGTGKMLLMCATSADFLVVAIDGNGQAMSSLFAEAVPLAAPTVLAGTYTSLDTTSFDYTDVPAGITSVRTYRAIATPRGRLYDDSTVAACDGQASSTLVMPEPAGAIAVTVSDGQPGGELLDEQVVYDWGASSTTYQLDFAGAMVGGVNSVPIYAPATRTVMWTERAGATPSDFVRVRIDVSRAAKAWTWSLVAPRSTDIGPSATFPQLFDYNPSDADGLSIAELVNAHVGGYDAFRAHGFQNFIDAVAGVSGRITVASYVLPGPL